MIPGCIVCWMAVQFILSRAKYKIGQYTEDDIYDLMIDIGKEKKLDYFCEQVRHYLGIIRSSDTAVPAGSL